MIRKVQLTSRAQHDVDEIVQWLHNRSPQGASSWYRRWKEILTQLKASADKSALAPESADHDEAIRHVMFRTRRGKSYRALFVVRRHDVWILHVRGPGQDFMAPDEIHLPP